MRFIYIIEKANDGSYSAYVPDLPGCTTSGDTIDEVRENMNGAAGSYLDSLREHNEPIPVPASVVESIDAA